MIYNFTFAGPRSRDTCTALSVKSYVQTAEGSFIITIAFSMYVVVLVNSNGIIECLKSFVAQMNW